MLEMSQSPGGVLWEGDAFKFVSIFLSAQPPKKGFNSPEFKSVRRDFRARNLILGSKTFFVGGGRSPRRKDLTGPNSNLFDGIFGAGTWF